MHNLFKNFVYLSLGAGLLILNLSFIFFSSIALFLFVLMEKRGI